MAKFLNKKEQVYDLKLTQYGKYLLSSGKFEPTYYAFYDNNVVYDGAYIGLTESQNQIVNRIKNETHYIESLVLFQELEGLEPIIESEAGDEFYFKVDVEPTTVEPKKDVFRFTSIIGDAFIDGEEQMAPAWKVVALNGEIKSTTEQDTKNNFNIPQVNIQLDYLKSVESAETPAIYLEQNLRDVIAETQKFSDGNVVRLVTQDLMCYVEELNTDTLQENFDIEVYEVMVDEIPATTDSPARDRLVKKFFSEDHQRIMGGLMTEKSLNAIDKYEDDVRDIVFNYTTASVEYYFDIVRDYQIPELEACKAASTFNRQSYYVDLDFDCESTQTLDPYLTDIYGPVTEPEICP